MTAPSVIYVESTQAAATSVLPSSSTITVPAVGDVLVVMLEGNTTSLPPISGINYSAGGTAGYTQVGSGATGSGTNRAQMWWKKLAAGDFSGANLKQLSPAGFASSGTTRWQVLVVRPASGDAFDSSTAVQSSAAQTANVTNGSTIVTLTGRSRPGFAVFCGVGVPGASGTVNWDAAGGVTPYCDSSSSVQTTGAGGSHYGTGTATDQADFKLYDTGTANITLAGSAGQTNTTHAVIVAFFQVAAPNVNAGGRLDAVSSTTGQALKNTPVGGRLDAVATFVARVPSPVFASGRLDGVSSFTASPILDFAVGARLDAVASFIGEGTIPQPAQARLDTVGWAYAMPVVHYVARGRLDAVAIVRAVQDDTKRAGGKADAVAAFVAHPVSVTAVGGRLDAVLSVQTDTPGLTAPMGATASLDDAGGLTADLDADATMTVKVR